MTSSRWTAKAVSCRCCNSLAEPDSERSPGLNAKRVGSKILGEGGSGVGVAG